MEATSVEELLGKGTNKLTTAETSTETGQNLESVELAFGPQTLTQEQEGSDMSNQPEDTDKWVEERVRRSEAEMRSERSKVEQMTQEVVNKVDRVGDQLESQVNRVQREQERMREDNRSLRSNLLTGASILAVVVVGLFTAILQRLGSVRDLVIDNTRRIAQLAGSDSTAIGSATSTGGLSWLVIPLGLVIFGLVLVIGVLVGQRQTSRAATGSDSEESQP